MGIHLIDLTARRFGKWTVIRFASGKRYRWLCRCQCGVKRLIEGGRLRGGQATQCRDCFLKLGMARTHGGSHTRLYRIWVGMRRRCEDPKCHKFPVYGARGISVCTSWSKDFPRFRAWSLKHGYRDNLTIDRIDNDQGYRPGNCRWVTRTESNKNRRKGGAS
jgi:hypothetical protein